MSYNFETPPWYFFYNIEKLEIYVLSKTDRFAGSTRIWKRELQAASVNRIFSIFIL